MVIGDRRNQILETDNPYKLLQELITDTLDFEIQIFYLNNEKITKENIGKFYRKLMLTYGIEIVLDKIDINNLHQKNFKDEFTNNALNQNMDLLGKSSQYF